jgi:hypothetical protein
MRQRVIKRPRVGDRLVTGRYGDVSVSGVRDYGRELTVTDRFGYEWDVERAAHGWWTRATDATAKEETMKDAELCKSDPSCRPIVLDGTGLSGTRCGYSVRRRRLLLPSYPAAGKTLVLEPCAEVARWSLPLLRQDGDGPSRRGYCTKHAAAVLRARIERETAQHETEDG